MWTNQTCWFNTVFTANPSMLGFMSLLLRHCFTAFTDNGDGEGETSSGGHYFFPCEIPASFPHRLFPSLCLSLSLTQSTVPYIFLHEPSLLHYAISISSHLSPFSPPALLLSLFSSAYISSFSLGSLFK